MAEYLVRRPFFDLGIKYNPGETIALTQDRVDSLLQAGVISEMPSSVKSEPPVTSTIVKTT